MAGSVIIRHCSTAFTKPVVISACKAFHPHLDREHNMINSGESLNAILDSLAEHIAVNDNQGNILFVNRAWAVFGRNNACSFNDRWKDVS
jgi:PAS domain-containing protein